MLAGVDVPTPYLLCDLHTVADRYARLRAALPDVRMFYAMKCNSTPEVLRALAALGSDFEVASIGELPMLQAVGVDPADVLFSNPIKPRRQSAAARAAGLWRFSFDSESELRKLAEHAPGSAVYIRLRVDDSTSVFPAVAQVRSRGPRLPSAYCCSARGLGLQPYGITFHVGSQCGAPSALAPGHSLDCTADVEVGR